MNELDIYCEAAKRHEYRFLDEVGYFHSAEKDRRFYCVYCLKIEKRKAS
jgi:hypothetical protein